MNSHLLRAKEVAERLNVSRSQAFALMRGDEIPTVRFGRCVRVRPEDLDEFIRMKLTNRDIDPLKTKLAASTARVKNNQANQQSIEVTYEK